MPRFNAPKRVEKEAFYMRIKRKVGRFVLYEDIEISHPIAFYVEPFDLIAICFGNNDCISASQELNKVVKEKKFLNRCISRYKGELCHEQITSN